LRQSCTIRRLHLSFLTPRDQPEPDYLRARVSDAVVATLNEALPAALAQLGGEGVLRIAHMDIDLTLDAALSPQAIAERLVEKIVENVVRARTGGERVFAYAGRGEFLAAFLTELVRGTAWQRWWFKSFDGVRPLSLSAAIRTSLLAQPGDCMDALLCLPRHELAAILGVLQPNDTTRLLHELAEQKSDIERGAAIASVLAVRRDAPASPLEPRAAALAAFVEVARRNKADACPRVASLVLALAELDKILTPLPQNQRKTFLAAVATAGQVERPAQLDAAILARLAPLIALPRALRNEILRAIPGATDDFAAPAPDEYRYTHFGGLFLLLASLDLAALDGVCAAAAWDEEVPLVSVIAFLTIAACAGGARAEVLLCDPVWRDIFGLPPALWIGEMAERLAVLPPKFWVALAGLGAPPLHRSDARFLLLPRHLSAGRDASHAIARLSRALLSRLTRRLPGAREYSAPALWRNLLCVGARIETGPYSWTATIARPPLDILLALSGIADGEIAAPNARRIRLGREAT